MYSHFSRFSRSSGNPAVTQNTNKRYLFFNTVNRIKRSGFGRRYFYRTQTQFAKVMFYTCLSVILFTGGGGEVWHAWRGGACVAGGMHDRGVVGGGGHGWQGMDAWQGVCVAGGMHGGGHAWQGGMHGGGHVKQGACMAGGMHGRGCMAGGRAWWGGVHGRYYKIWSMSGRYASYWNAFLCIFHMQPWAQKFYF